MQHTARTAREVMKGICPFVVIFFSCLSSPFSLPTCTAIWSLNVTLALLLLIVRGSVHPIAHVSYAGIPLLWPVCTEYTLGPLLGSATSPPTNLWAIRREWLRGARSDTNPTHIPPSVVAHRATTLTTFVAVSVRKIYLHPATVMAALQLL
jgi:hypothetical protein